MLSNMKEPLEVHKVATYTVAESYSREAIRKGFKANIYHSKNGYWIVEVYD